MLSANFLDLLHEVVCLMKKRKAAFGTVMIISVGDVAQLTPLPEFHEVSSSKRTEIPKEVLQNSLLRAALGGEPNSGVSWLSHCWRYDIDGRSDIFLSALRMTSVLTGELNDEIKAL